MKKSFENLLGNALAGKDLSEKEIRNRIVIREDLKALIPPLSDDELNVLEENILKDGIRDALTVWGSGSEYTLVDGHNRFSISQKHGLDFPFRILSFKDEEEVRDWMINNQLGRRNLSPEQLSYLRGLRYNREKSQGKRNDLTSDQNDPRSGMSTAAQLGSEFNVSEATIKRDGEFAESIDAIGLENPRLKEEILKGKSQLSKKQISAMGKGQSSKNNAREAERLTPNSIVAIAYRYIQTEKRSLEQVYTSMGKEPESLTPKEYFSLWNSLNPNNEE